MLRSGMDISHGHLDVGVAGEFTERRQINASHRHAGEGSVAQVV